MLKELYTGTVNPRERRARDNDRRRSTISKIEAEEQYITDKLSPEDGERFKSLICLYNDLAGDTETEVFSYAFSMAVLMMMDVSTEAKTMMTDEE